jgi:hypothetical protein
MPPEYDVLVLIFLSHRPKVGIYSLKSSKLAPSKLHNHDDTRLHYLERTA